MKQLAWPLFVIFITLMFLAACNGNSGQNTTDVKATQNHPEKKTNVAATSESENKQVKPQITFIELGSVKCVPCRMMQPVMESIEEKYGKQIEVIFYDVWKQEQRHYAQEYGIRMIPTQVFLDKSGSEIYRHEGFFPEEELDAFLQSEGLEIQSNSQRN